LPLTKPHIPGPSRCFPFWQEVLACYVTNTNSEDVSGKAKCTPYLEDYYECLHHKKEVSFPSSFSPASLFFPSKTFSQQED
jgi:NADH dehydrogenase (ubiquinone) Fe-S protein 5